jgi:hypothetical protein
MSSALSPATSSFLSPSSRGLKASRTRLGRLTPPRELASATDARTTRLRRTQAAPSSSHGRNAHESRRARPALKARARTLPASTAFRPAYVTIAIRPSCRDGTKREHIEVGRGSQGACRMGKPGIRGRQVTPRSRDDLLRGMATVSSGGDKANSYQAQAWVDGFLSGENSASDGPDFLAPKPNTVAYYAWIDNYSARNP